MAFDLKELGKTRLYSLNVDVNVEDASTRRYEFPLPFIVVQLLFVGFFTVVILIELLRQYIHRWRKELKQIDTAVVEVDKSSAVVVQPLETLSCRDDDDDASQGKASYVPYYRTGQAATSGLSKHQELKASPSIHHHETNSIGIQQIPCYFYRDVEFPYDEALHDRETTRPYYKKDAIISETSYFARTLPKSDDRHQTKLQQQQKQQQQTARDDDDRCNRICAGSDNGDTGWMEERQSEKFPSDWNATKNNLGVAESKVRDGDSTAVDSKQTPALAACKSDIASTSQNTYALARPNKRNRPIDDDDLCDVDSFSSGKRMAVAVALSPRRCKSETAADTHLDEDYDVAIEPYENDVGPYENSQKPSHSMDTSLLQTTALSPPIKVEDLDNDFYLPIGPKEDDDDDDLDPNDKALNEMVLDNKQNSTLSPMEEMNIATTAAAVRPTFVPSACGGSFHGQPSYVGDNTEAPPPASVINHHSTEQDFMQVSPASPTLRHPAPSTDRKRKRRVHNQEMGDKRLIKQAQEEKRNKSYEIYREEDANALHWELYFQRLCRMKAANQGTSVVFLGAANWELRDWVSRQRALHTCEPRAISIERVAKLDSIGFVWSPGRAGSLKVLSSPDNKASSEASENGAEEIKKQHVVPPFAKIKL